MILLTVGGYINENIDSLYSLVEGENILNDIL